MLTRLMITLSVLLAVSAAHAVNEDLFEDDEGARRGYPTTEPIDAWKELETGLPEFPREKNLIALDMSAHNFPFAVFIDAKSVSVDKDRVIRYTVVVRSRSGVDNISYEGILCRGHKVKRYGYASDGQMVAAPAAEWRFIKRGRRQDSYRSLLAYDIFCPLPMGNPAREIVSKLKQKSPSTPGFFDYAE